MPGCAQTRLSLYCSSSARFVSSNGCIFPVYPSFMRSNTQLDAMSSIHSRLIIFYVGGERRKKRKEYTSYATYGTTMKSDHFNNKSRLPYYVNR